jgi:hypothetical protein
MTPCADPLPAGGLEGTGKATVWAANGDEGVRRAPFIYREGWNRERSKPEGYKTPAAG